MNQEQKGQLYNQLLAEYHNLENQIGQIKMNNFDLNAQQQQQVNLLEKKKAYIMSRVQSLF